MSRPSVRHLRAARSCRPCNSRLRSVSARSINPSTALRITARVGDFTRSEPGGSLISGERPRSRGALNDSTRPLGARPSARRGWVGRKDCSVVANVPSQRTRLGRSFERPEARGRIARVSPFVGRVSADPGEAYCADRDAASASLRLVVGTEARKSAHHAAHGAIPHPLELRAVSKAWRGKPHPVVDRVDLSVAHGTAILLTGRNGTGKTTLLRLAAGVITPDRGSVTVQGLTRERSRREFSRRIAYLPAGGSGLYARLPVRRHLDLAARLALLEPAERTVAVEQAMDAFDLRPLACARVDRLSMGQRQRVRMAMALLHRPGLALLDEPSTSLDDDGVEILRSALSMLLARGGATIWCEPSGGRAEFEFDRHLVLEEGKLHAA